MSSSTSSSSEIRFLLWIAIILGLSSVIAKADIWKGTDERHRGHLAVAKKFGANADYLLVGDSKTGPFSYDGLSPFLSRKGLVFSSDSVTPVYHFYTFRRARSLYPEFKPKVVFISIGANNFNENGLHCRRDFALENLLSWEDVRDLTLPTGQTLEFFEVMLGHVLPIYTRRLQLTHFDLTLHPSPTGDIALETLAWNESRHQARLDRHEPRDRFLDQNYLDIYRRSVLNQYKHSTTVELALSKMIEDIRSYGGVPILVMLPLTQEMRDLEKELIGDKFKSSLNAFAQREKVELMDFQAEDHYEFNDVNHLSPKGAFAFGKDNLEPILGRMLR